MLARVKLVAIVAAAAALLVAALVVASTPSARRAGDRLAAAHVVSVLEMRAAEAGILAVGYFAQVPHYVSGPYPPAALALHRAVARHLDVALDSGQLGEESEQLRTRLDAATSVDENTRGYVERLEAMVDEERLPAGDDLISEIEQFLRDQGSEGRPRS